MPNEATTGPAQGATAGTEATDAHGATGTDTEAHGAPAEGQAHGAPADEGGGTTDTRSPADLAEAVRVREAENATYRARIRELEAAEAERTRAGMTEAERMQTELEEARRTATEATAALAERAYGDDVAGIAGRLGYRDPLDAAAFVPRSTVLGADGTVDETKLTAKLRDTLKAKPYLGNGGGSGDGGAGRERQPTGTSWNDEIRNRARR